MMTFAGVVSFLIFPAMLAAACLREVDAHPFVKRYVAYIIPLPVRMAGSLVMNPVPIAHSLLRPLVLV
jgi:hypothetical protein